MAPRLVARVASVVGAALLTVVAAAPAASAHARLLSSSPGDGTSVNPRLRAITLTFDDAVQLVPRSLVVTGVNGAPLPTAAPQLASSRVLQAKLLDRLRPGHYVVAWRILADDGHIESGSFGFSVVRGAAAPATPTAPPVPAQPVWPVVVAAVLAVAALGGAALVVGRGARAVQLGELLTSVPGSADEPAPSSVHVLSQR